MKETKFNTRPTVINTSSRSSKHTLSITRVWSDWYWGSMGGVDPYCIHGGECSHILCLLLCVILVGTNTSRERKRADGWLLSGPGPQGRIWNYIIEYCQLTRLYYLIFTSVIDTIRYRYIHGHEILVIK